MSERKLQVIKALLHKQGFNFYDEMDVIYECGVNYEKLIGTTYLCVVSRKRTTLRFTIDFRQTDFFHLAGLTYLTDIDLPRNKSTTIQSIKNGEITDSLLFKSSHYRHDVFTNRDIHSRVGELRFLEAYLDTNNFISIYNTRDGGNQNSLIDAEYIIQSRRPNSSTDAYIFLRKREESDYYLVVSFFVKGAIAYGGEKLYWMLKEKICDGKSSVLFQHPNYNKNDDIPKNDDAVDGYLSSVSCG